MFMKRLVVLLVLCALVAAPGAYAREYDEEEISWPDVPKAVKETINKKVGDGRITEIVKKTIRGKIIYEFEVKHGRKELDYSVDPDGKFLGIEGPGHAYKGAENEEDESGGRADGREQDSAEKDDWVKSFDVAAKDFASTGRNTYFILEPGYRLVLKGRGEVVEIMVTNATKVVDGVTTRIVEERETKNGKLVEVSRNYFAIDKKTNDIYYFGEEVDMYERGKVTTHEGAWLSGVDGARYGLIMPAKPQVGFKHYQEIAPDMAMDRAEIVSVSETFESPAGKFTDCLQVDETTPLEPGEHSIKVYAPGVGLVKDGGTMAVEYGFVKKSGKKK
jgi:polyhydroxyalkanoate synthesis regulator protein